MVDVNGRPTGKPYGDFLYLSIESTGSDSFFYHNMFSPTNIIRGEIIFYKRDGDGNIVEKPDAQEKIKEYINSKKNTSNKPYSEPTVLLTNENISSSNEEHSIYSRKSNIFLLDSCANIPIVRRPVSNAISCNVHINTLERNSTVHSTELGITHVIAVDIDLKPIKIIFKAYYIPPYGLTMEENFNVLPAYRFCQINRKVPMSEDPQFKLDGIESKFSLIATDNSVVHFKMIYIIKCLF